MKLKFAYTIGVGLVLLCNSLSGFGQVTVRATVDKNKIVIGEQVLLKLEVSVPQNDLIRFFIIDTIPHFEFIEKKKIDTLDTREGTILSQQMRITSFDSGSFVIPSFILDNASDLKTDSILVEVGFAPFDPKADYNDIKDVMDVEVPEPTNNDWIYIVGAAVLLLLVILIIVFRRKKKPAPVITPSLTAYEKAMQQLQNLKKQNPPDKIFYTKLTDIFREYLFLKKGIQSMQPTTEELVVVLKQINYPADQYQQIAQSLRLSDYVKFAKYQPVPQENDFAFDIIREGIQTIEKAST
ncbi:MAG TPA: GGIII-like transmembrane region-containing protein [Chitinophagaceae bacterium]